MVYFMSYIIVITTFGNKEEATIGVKRLLQEKLIACGNIIDSVSSLFWWNKKIEEQKEVLVLMKSHKNLFKKLSERIKESHSYDVPEIIALPITEVSKSYLDWMKSFLEPVKNIGKEAD